MKCMCCGVDTPNPKFCSRSCSAKINNKTPKRERRYKLLNCVVCGKECAYMRKFCDSCVVPDLMLKQAMYRRSPHMTKNSLIRSRAKKVVEGRAKLCAWCGYTKHVEICHIKAIKDFEPDSLLSEVNAEDNLLLLCRNCHWEHDHP